MDLDDYADPGLLEELASFGTATLYEAASLPCALPCQIQAGWPGARIAGRALPVLTAPGDNLPLHLALEAAEPGEVLVVEGHDGPYGYWGEVMTAAAVARGLGGLVINGCVRDISAIAALEFPVFATGRSIVGTVKSTLGRIGEPMRLGGAQVDRGDVVVGDADGVVVIPSERVENVIATSRARAAAEASYMRRLQAGELTLDVYNLRDIGTNPAPPK